MEWQINSDLLKELR